METPGSSSEARFLFNVFDARLNLIVLLNAPDILDKPVVADDKVVADAHVTQQVATDRVEANLVFALGHWLAVKYVDDRLDGVELVVLVAVELDFHAVFLAAVDRTWAGLPWSATHDWSFQRAWKTQKMLA